MKKLLIDPGVCGFRTLVTAVYNEDEDEVTLRVDSGCKHVREMMDTLGDTFDSFALCLSRCGTLPAACGLPGDRGHCQMRGGCKRPCAAARRIVYLSGIT